MKKLLRVLKWVGIVLLIIIAGVFVTGYFLYNKKYNAPYPQISASTDSVVIAHGKHLIFGTAHCAQCHFKPDDSLKAMSNETFDLAGGGFPFTFPGGAFYSANISSDKEFGIGNIPDSAIARTLRYGVKHDGSILIPAMEYQNLSDEDITAIISYLRTTNPVHYKVHDDDFNLLGKGIIAFFIRPQAPEQTPPKAVRPDTTASYGKYVVESVAHCKSCHTERNQNTGAYIGENLAGGVFGPLDTDPTKILVTPNLTPDSTGILFNWTYAEFAQRFKEGILIKESIMPWPAYKNLDSTELVAIWKYLHTIKPVHKINGPAIQAAKK